MPVKTILLHMAPTESRHERFRVALDMAKRYGAHLEIAYMVTPVSMPAQVRGRGASSAYIAEAQQIAREKAVAIETEITEECKEAGVSWSWEILEGNHNELLAERSHYADIVIVHEDHGVSLEDYIGLHTPDDLLMMAVCPVLVLPKRRKIKILGHRVMLAWKDCRQAANVVHKGLSFLQEAEKVYVLTCDRPHHRFEAGRDINTYLERHGVAVEPVSDVAGGDVGDVILSYAHDLQIDLLMMGAYGHSRWREIVLGGTTHHILKSIPVPLLMSH